MADKLDWLNKHLTLIRYLTVADTVEKEGYKIRPDLEEHFEGVRGVEEMVFKLARLPDYKSACELLAYAAHRRAGVWWLYRCILSLVEELALNPAVDRDIADIGASFDVKVPDWAKVEIPKPDPAQMEQVAAALKKAQAEAAEARTKLDPEMLKFVEDAVEVAFQEFKRVHGIHPIDLLKKAASRVGEDPYRIDPKSPIYTELGKIKGQIQASRLETIETIKAVIPPTVPAHEKKLRDNALDAVYRWVAAPDEANSKACLDIGNECPGTPAGLLALSAFWASGNLTPGSDQVVPTPAGLPPNGLVQTLLLCGLHKGGTRKVKERYEVYFNLGVEVLSGRDNWDESLVLGEPPHRTMSGAAPVEAPPAGAEPAEKQPEKPPTEKPPEAPNGGYKRWKPEI
jgi:hypothetical protein